MKKLICVLLVIIPLWVSAQDTLSYQRQIDNIQLNLKHYHAEKMIGYMVSGLSTAVLTAGVLSFNQDTQNSLICVSAGLSIMGLVLIIDSEKWIKRASVRITPTKLTIRF